MLSKNGPIRQAVERWARQRFAFPILVAIAATLLFVSEKSYLDTTFTLKGGIDLTDARIQSLRLLQLVTEAENAQLGFIATGQPVHLTRQSEIKAAMPETLGAVTAYFGALDSKGAESAQRITDLTQRAFSQIDKVMALAAKGQQRTVDEVAQNQQTQTAVMALRRELTAQLADAA